MTRFNEDQIHAMQNVVGLEVTDLYYEEEGDYFVMEFSDGTETTFRFMADLYEE